MNNMKKEIKDTLNKAEHLANNLTNDTKNMVEDAVHDVKSNVDSIISRADMKREDMMNEYNQKKFSKQIKKQMTNNKLH